MDHKSSPPKMLQSSSAESVEVPGDRVPYQKLSASQLQAYFVRIGLSKKHLSTPILRAPHLARTLKHGMPFLKSLVMHHQAHIPWENLNIRCYPKPLVKLDPEELFDRIIINGRGRGGTCPMVTCLFSNVLRSLGFEVVDTVARMHNVGKTPRFNAFGHMVLLVTLSEQTYLVDVGLAKQRPFIILPLQHLATAMSLASEEMRLVYGHLAESSSSRPAYKVWRLEIRSCLDSPWIPKYAFHETEYFLSDLEIISWHWVTNSESFFSRDLFVSLLTVDEDKECVTGHMVLNGPSFEVIKNHRVERSLQCPSFEERLRILWEYFAIELTAKESMHLEKSLRSMNAPKL